MSAPSWGGLLVNVCGPSSWAFHDRLAWVPARLPFCCGPLSHNLSATAGAALARDLGRRLLDDDAAVLLLRRPVIRQLQQQRRHVVHAQARGLVRRQVRIHELRQSLREPSARARRRQELLHSVHGRLAPPVQLPDAVAADEDVAVHGPQDARADVRHARDHLPLRRLRLARALVGKVAERAAEVEVVLNAAVTADPSSRGLDPC
mmetsp:Transcript_103273/g.301284  ORF Transcript_103273/g.301284 Transcript_103273/m.301284 type:complete len:205 (+) Transcript_103273:135-749(+)